MFSVTGPSFAFGSELYLFVAALGLICGSFVTALSYRLPRGEDFVRGRSRCPRCKTVLSARDLFPVFSWVMSRGRCRYCGVTVSGRYPLIELLCAVLFVAVVVWAGESADPLRVIVLWVLTVSLLSLAVIDLEFRRLPNGLVTAVLVLSGLLAWIDQRPAEEMAFACGIAFGAGIILRFIGGFLSSGVGLGWGDIKLTVALALNVTLDNVAVFLAVTGIFAAGLAVWLYVRRTEAGVPLGPALCAGAFAALV